MREMHALTGLTRVSIGLETAPQEAAAVERVFNAADVRVIVDPEIARFSVESPWVMYLTAPLGAFATRFAGSDPSNPEAGGAGLARFLDHAQLKISASVRESPFQLHTRIL